MQKNPHSFDVTGLLFTLKFALGIECLVTLAHYGTAFGAQLVLAPLDTSEIDAQLELKKTERAVRSVQEKELCDKLEGYEQTRALQCQLISLHAIYRNTHTRVTFLA